MKYSMVLCWCVMAVCASQVSHAKPTDGEIYTYRVIYGYLREIATPDELKNYPEAINQAVADAIAGKPSRYSDEEMLIAMANIEQQRQQKQLEKITENRIKGKQFLTQNAQKAGVITTKSGLQYKIIKQGNGKNPRQIRW